MLAAPLPARAHEARPAYLEIREMAPGRYSVLWRTPVMAGMRLPIVLKLPDDVRNIKDPTVQELTDSLVERRLIDAGPKGLAGKRIEFPGLQVAGGWGGGPSGPGLCDICFGRPRRCSGRPAAPALDSHCCARHW